MVRARYYNISRGAAFTATSASKIFIGDEVWTVASTASVTPGTTSTDFEYVSTVPEGATTKILIESGSYHGLFYTAGDVPVGQAVLLLPEENWFTVTYVSLPIV